MNAEHQALAEYLEAHIDKRLSPINEQLHDIARDLKNLTLQVDDKNDRQDEEIENHEARIRVLESTII